MYQFEVCIKHLYVIIIHQGQLIRFGSCRKKANILNSDSFVKPDIPRVQFSPYMAAKRTSP